MTLPGPFPSWVRGERRSVAEAVVVGLMVVVIHLLFRLSAGFLVGVLNDDGVYVVLGKAIADGAGYRSIHLVGAPLQVRYPPGLPLLLAVPWALGGTLAAVRATVAVLHPIAVASTAGLLWWLGRARISISPWPLAVCAVAPLVLDGSIQYFNIALTEPYLVLGWVSALALAAPLLAPRPAASATRHGRAVALGLVLAATALFRTAGVALIPAALLAMAVHRRWKDVAACAVAAIVPLLAWQGLEAYWMARIPLSSQPDDLSYWRWLGVNGPWALLGYAMRTVGMNAVEYVGKLASYLFSNQAVGAVVVLAAAGAAGVACVRLRRTQPALVFTTLCSLALTLMWPFAQGRLLLPLLPFLGLLVASTVEDGMRRCPVRLKWALPVALGVAGLAVTSRQIELRAVAARAYEAGVPVSLEDQSPSLTLALRSRFIYQAAQWVRARTALQDRVMVDAPAGVYLYTGRRTLPGSPTESRLRETAFEVPGAYLADRVLADSITVVVWSPPAPELERDIVVVETRCPGVLEHLPAAFAACFRVHRDERCLSAARRGLRRNE